MSKEETRNVRGLGPFRLLRRCDEVEPRLGRLSDPMRHAAAEFMPVESLTWIDKTEAPLVIAYPMPDAAFPEQQKPPCDEGDVEIRGGCWGVMEQRAPCHKGYAEYQGRCYAPVRKKKPVPRSLQR